MNSERPCDNPSLHLSKQVVFIAALWLAVVPCHASVPDWLRTAAREPLPPYPKTCDAVVLLDEQQTIISADGRIKTVTRRAIRILRDAGKAPYERAGTYFDSETQISYFKGWSLSADGSEYEIKEKDTVETSFSPEDVYRDTRYKVMRFPGVGPGTVVGYEYQQNRRPYILQDLWDPQWKVPVRHARYTLQLSNGWKYRQAWLNGTSRDPVPSAQNQLVWEMADIPPIPNEPRSPSLRAVATQLGLTFIPPSPLSAHAFSSWAEVAEWHAELATASMRSSPAIDQQVQKLIANAPSQDAKVRVLSAYVQQQIRYVAIEIGIGGYQPHAADSTFSNRYGDCKDKATLLVVMLRQAGIKAYPVAINASRGVVRPEFPSPYQFNHMIVAIELAPDSTLATAPAATDIPSLGRLLFFDPTAEVWPIGLLVDELQNNTGLLIAGNSAQLVTLPVAAPESSQLTRSGEYTLASDGSVAGKITETYTGSWAARMREELAEMTQAQKKQWIDLIATRMPGSVTVTHVEIHDQSELSNALGMSYEIHAVNYAELSGDLMLVRPPLIVSVDDKTVEWKSSDGEARKLPIEYEHTGIVREICIFQLPQGYEIDELPDPAQFKQQALRYSSAFELKARQLTAARDYTVADLTVAPSDISAVKSFYRKVHSDEQKTIVLKLTK